MGRAEAALEATRRWRARNPQKCAASSRAAKRAGRDWLREQKRGPCVDCGGRFDPVCMDFDHVRGTKLFEVGSCMTRSREAFEQEIKKCDLVCSNCHRVRTAIRAGWRIVVGTGSDL